MPSHLRFHDYQFDLVVPTGRWRWTTRLDVSLSVPSYLIRDVQSPFGILRDSIPIPGEVIQAMADSITSLKTQFAPGILVGPPSSLTFMTDEGRGFSEGEELTLTNNGVFGSLLGATLTSSAPYVRVTPGFLGSLAANESGLATVEVDAASLLASESPYNETITIQDPTAPNSPQVFPVTVVVRPKSEIDVSTALLTFTVVRPISGGYPGIAPQTFTITNDGPPGSVLDFKVKKLTGCSDWLTSFLPATGSLASGASQVVTVTVAPPQSMVWGTYTEKLRVCGYSSNSHLDVEIRLVIT